MTDTIESLRAERDLLFDALNLHMRSTGITTEAMSRVDAFRAVVEANEPRVRGECGRLEKGWQAAADRAKQAEARLAEVERERDAVLWERNAIEDRLATAIAQSAEARGRLAEIEIEMRMMLPPGKTLPEILRERVAVRVALGGDASPLADDDSLLRAQCALAACAEMREAAVGVDGRCRLCTARPREHRDNCALSRTDLGRWWASPEDTAQMVGALQMVEGDGEFDSLHEVTRKFVVDVLALIKKGGW